MTTSMTTETTIEVVPLMTAEDLVNELSPMTGRIWRQWRTGAPAEDWLFRGQRDARWGIRPSAFRPDPFKRFKPVDVASLPIADRDEQRIEFHYVRQFAGLADQLGFHVPGDAPLMRDPRPRPGRMVCGPYVPFFPPTDYLYMFALAQHYGVPTRLVDWTYKPLASAYFAARGRAADDGSPELAVWALKRNAVDKALGSATWEDRARGVLVSFVSAPTATNPNLAAQAGAFTLVYDPQQSQGMDGPVGETVRNIDDVLRDQQALFSGQGPVMFKFTIPESEIPRLLHLLAEHRVHAGTIYPGFAGVACAMEEELLHG